MPNCFIGYLNPIWLPPALSSPALGCDRGYATASGSLDRSVTVCAPNLGSLRSGSTTSRKTAAGLGRACDAHLEREAVREVLPLAERGRDPQQFAARSQSRRYHRSS